MGYQRVAPEIKEQILKRIREDGIPAGQAAKEHGVRPNTVYSWLSSGTQKSSAILQINRLKRENEDLKRLLAEAMLLQERSKKKNPHHAF